MRAFLCGRAWDVEIDKFRDSFRDFDRYVVYLISRGENKDVARGREKWFMVMIGRLGCFYYERRGKSVGGLDSSVTCFDDADTHTVSCTIFAYVGLYESKIIQYFCNYCLALVNSWKFFCLVFCLGFVSRYEKYYCLYWSYWSYTDVRQ